MRMKQSACDARGNGNQFLLSGKDFHLAGAGEFREVHGAAHPNFSGVFFGRGDGRKFRKQFPRMDEEFVRGRVFEGCFYVVEGVSVRERELSYAGAPQRSQMGSAAENLPHVVRDSAHVSARSNPSAETDAVLVNSRDLEFLDLGC